MRSISKYAVAAAALLSATAMAGASQAAIFIGMQQAGVDGDGAGALCVTGGICTVASGASNAVFSGAYGTFEEELTTGTASVEPTLLGSTSSDTNKAKTTGGTLNIYVTRTNISGPIPLSFRSTFTSNVLPAGWTVAESTYVDTGNGLYGGSLLSSHSFATIGTFEHTEAFAGGTGPYSLTTKYTITAPTGGSSLSTISIHTAAVPEPGVWALMIMGFGGAGAMLRNRRRQAVAA